MSNVLIPNELIENKIYLIRGKKVMFDRDMAELYRVPTRRLNEQVKRNIKRFPSDFMFQLSLEEAKASRSHFAILKKGQKEPKRKKMPIGFYPAARRPRTSVCG